jgi:hypothetical protein
MAPVLLVPRTEGGQAPSELAAWVASGVPGGHLEWDGENGEDDEDGAGGEDGENRRTPHAARTLSHRTKPTSYLPYLTLRPPRSWHPLRASRLDMGGHHGQGYWPDGRGLKVSQPMGWHVLPNG